MLTVLSSFYVLPSILSPKCIFCSPLTTNRASVPQRMVFLLEGFSLAVKDCLGTFFSSKMGVPASTFLRDNVSNFHMPRFGSCHFKRLCLYVSRVGIGYKSLPIIFNFKTSTHFREIEAKNRDTKQGPRIFTLDFGSGPKFDGGDYPQKHVQVRPCPCPCPCPCVTLMTSFIISNVFSLMLLVFVFSVPTYVKEGFDRAQVSVV